MSARKRLQPAEADVGGVESKRKTPLASAAEYDTCNFLIEAVSPEFDPQRVLRRVFFIDENKTRYISVVFYPTQNYRPMVEFGRPMIKPVILTEQHVATRQNVFRRYVMLCVMIKHTVTLTVFSD